MIFGFLCILYYIVICRYTRKWDSKFPRLWPVLGCVVILFVWQKQRIPESVLLGVHAAAAAFLLCFLAVEALIVSGLVSPKKEEECEYLIVLGARVDGRNLTDALRQRLDRAVRYLKEHKDCRAVVSGGQGSGELITEACAMADYLRKCGIENERILREEASRTTRENLIFSGRVLLRDRAGRGLPESQNRLGNVKVGIVTNSFHMYRAAKIAEQTGYDAIQRLPAPTTKIMMVNYMTREFFGVLKMWMQRNQK